MKLARTAILTTSALLAISGCATVAVYEPVNAIEISLDSPHSILRVSSEEYCEDAIERGLATGESSLSGLASVLLGRGDDSNAYWRKIGADNENPAFVMEKIHGDISFIADGLTELDKIARELVIESSPKRRDIVGFERALIHARQSRDSIEDAIAKLNARGTDGVETASVMETLDGALKQATQTADMLAEAGSGQSA